MKYQQFTSEDEPTFQETNDNTKFLYQELVSQDVVCTMGYIDHGTGFMELTIILSNNALVLFDHYGYRSRMLKLDQSSLPETLDRITH